jgi:hypothetical protein
MEGTLQLRCKVCGAGIKVPVGKPLTDAQCSYGCYEIYPEVISWDARLQRLRFHRAEAVALVQRYYTYDKLVAACRRMLAHEGKIPAPARRVTKEVPVKVTAPDKIQVVAREEDGKIHIDVVLPANITPAKRSKKKILTKS